LWRRHQHDRARARWNALCATLARAGLPRLPHEGPLDYATRAANRWPELATAFNVIGDSYAMLRYGRGASQPDNHHERASILSRFEHEIQALPRPSTLRRLQRAA
jgi:hypothetical protein